MKALLVAAAPVAGSAELVALLAVDSDLVIAVDGGGSVCLEAGVTPDMVLGDFDSLAPEALAQLTHAGTRVVAFPTRKDQTDLELAFHEARASGATEVALTCATSGRLDHTLGALGALAVNADLCPVLTEPDAAGWVLTPQGRDAVRLAGPGATISLLAMSAGPAIVSAAGVEWPLDRFELTHGSGLGLSNIVVGEAGALITVHEGVLLVLAPRLDGLEAAARL